MKKKKVKRRRTQGGHHVHVEASPKMSVHVHSTDASSGNEADKALANLRTNPNKVVS